MYTVDARKVDFGKRGKLEIIGLYWHFADVVWIVIFTIVYSFPTIGETRWQQLDQLTESAEENVSWVQEDWIYIKTAIVLAVFTAIEVRNLF